MRIALLLGSQNTIVSLLDSYNPLALLLGSKNTRVSLLCHTIG